MNVPPSKRPHLYIVTEEREAFENGRDYLCRLAYAGEVIVSEDVPADADKMVSIVTKDARCFLPMSELVDLDKERERLEKEKHLQEAMLSGGNKIIFKGTEKEYEAVKKKLAAKVKVTSPPRSASVPKSLKRSLPISRNRSVSSADAHIIRLTKVSRNATMTLRDIF